MGYDVFQKRVEEFIVKLDQAYKNQNSKEIRSVLREFRIFLEGVVSSLPTGVERNLVFLYINLQRLFEEMYNDICRLENSLTELKKKLEKYE